MSITPTFKIDNSTSDTVVFRGMYIVKGAGHITDSAKETIHAFIPSELMSIPGSFYTVSAPSYVEWPTEAWVLPTPLSGGTELTLRMPDGMLEGDTLILENKLLVTPNAGCGTVPFFNETYFLDSVECGSSGKCGFNSQLGRANLSLTIERYKFTLGSQPYFGEMIDSTWNSYGGSTPIVAQTKFFANDTINIDFYIDENNNNQIDVADGAIVKTIKYIIAADVNPGEVMNVPLLGIPFKPERQLLAYIGGEKFCENTTLPIVTISGKHIFCQGDTNTYLLPKNLGIVGVDPYYQMLRTYFTPIRPLDANGNIIELDAITGATVKHIDPGGPPVWGSQNFKTGDFHVDAGNYMFRMNYWILPENDPKTRQLGICVFNITLCPVPYLTYTLNKDTTICQGDRVELGHAIYDTVITQSAGYNRTYNYYTNIGGIRTLIGSEPEGTNFHVQPNDTTTYSIEIVYSSATLPTCNSTFIDYTVNVNKMPLIGSINTISLPNCSTNTGSIQLSIARGSGSYEYSLNNGATYTNLPLNSKIENLAVGNYQIYLRDKIRTGCSASISEPINLTLANSGLYATSQTTNATDCNSTDGTIKLIVNGGVLPYRYAINNGSYTDLPDDGIIGNNFAAGIYQISIIDLANCATTTLEATIVKTTNGLNMGLTQITPANCATEGTLRIALSNGIPGYSYRLNGGGWVPIFGTVDTINITAGLHTIFAKDANGCETADTIRIGNTADLSMFLVGVSDASCDGTMDGSIQLNIIGSAEPLTYSLNGGITNFPATAGSFTISGLSLGTYNIRSNGQK